MLTRLRIAFGLALILSLILAIPVIAGGWAVITLDELPTDVVAGEPITISFTVLQHGKTPMTDLEPTITASSNKGQEFVVDAKPDGISGHYSATITFPNEGEWNWSIQAFSMDQSMPVLSVAVPDGEVVSQPVVKSEPATAPFSILTILRLAALGIGLAGMVLAFWRKSRLVMALTAACLLIGVGSFVMAPAVPKVDAQSVSSSETVREDVSTSQVELGEQLFVAKGCVTCHTNNKVSRTYVSWVVSGAPNLTNFSASPESLRLWLKDPVAVKSETWMPNLHLSDAEIEALIAFINSK